MKLLSLAILFTLIYIQPGSFAANMYTQEEALSSDIVENLLGRPAKPKAIFPYKSLDLVAAVYSIGSGRLPQEAILLWRKNDTGNFELISKVLSEKGESFAKPDIFTIDQYSFVNLSTEPSGSGGFVREVIYWLAPDRSLHEVRFQPASEIYENMLASGEIVLSGGEKEFFVDGNAMRFQFWLAEPGDPHCCPTGGSVTGTYKLSGSPDYDSVRRQYQANFVVTVDQLHHSKGDYVSETDLNSISR